MRYLFLTGVLGFSLLVALVYHYGLNDIVQALAAVGWGMGLIVAMRFLQVGGAAMSWSFLFPRQPRISARIYVELRLVREGINTLLPVAQVGGEFIGARLLSHAGLTIGAATASVIVDLFLQAFTQAIFTIAGLGALILIGGDATLIREVAAGLMVLVPGLIGFFLVQRLGGFGWIERRIIRIAESRNWIEAGKTTDLNDHIQRLYRDRPTIARSTVLHLAVWIAGSGEIWLALTFMGQPISFAEALIIESLSQALRSATFVVPAGLGVQEGGMIALCAAFGLTPGVALALSFTKRVAELAVGGVGLFIWHILESRIALSRSAGLQAGGS